jgi:hypothetical protein
MATKRFRARRTVSRSTTASAREEPAEAQGDAATAARPRLAVEVVWGDITKVEGDAFVVGHYVGVLPQNAERALDAALSGATPGAKQEGNLILTDLTRRGAIRGSLGDVIFFPWQGRGQVVLAGMGRVGSFSQPQLRTLARSLAQAISRLMHRPRISSVLIGSGFGNLGVEEAVGGYLAGFAEALKLDDTLELGTLCIVERDLGKAYEVLEALHQEPITSLVKEHQIQVPEDLADGGGGAIAVPFGFSWMLALLARACHEGPQSRFWGNVDGLVNELPDALRQGVRVALGELGARRGNARRLAASAFRLGGRPPERDEFADRVSFYHDGTRLSGGAIMNMATVKATDLDVGLRWIDRIVEDLEAPPPEEADRRAFSAFRFVVHPELREKLQGETKHLVIEVDREMARVPWEMLRADEAHDPIGVHRPLARQLRTTYSPALGASQAPRPLRMLVIGDPDGTLEFAVEEATKVEAIAKRHGIDVELRLGPPDELGLGKHPGVKAADLFEVLRLLLAGEFDLVHYSGHAEFFPQFPDRSGWVFKDERLTPSKLEGLEQPPRLIVANACISAAVSQKADDGRAGQPGDDAADSRGTSRRLPVGDARLVASLADEFFRRGVADYIGTAWEVPDGPAQRFAETFWEALLQGYHPGPGRATERTLGEALQQARKVLYERRSEWGEFATAWAAYQHYGDPTRPLRE